MHNNITLRKISIKDLDAYYEWINDKSLVEFNSQFFPVSKKKHAAWFKLLSVKNDIETFSIVKGKEELIGSCSLRNLDFINKTGELQIRIGNKACLNKGYGTQAIHLLVEYGFLNILLNKIYLHVFDDNIRAIKAYENCKFKKEKLIRNYTIIGGKKKNAYLMSIIKSQLTGICENE